MTIIAWDGIRLAVDCASLCGELAMPAQKMIVDPVKGIALAWCGMSDGGRTLARWYLDGADPDKWPEIQKDKDDWTRLVVAERGLTPHIDLVTVSFYERLPEKQFYYGAPFAAWGSGRDFAMGAMAMAADATEAVRVANKLCVSCGLGVSWVDFSQPGLLKLNMDTVGWQGR